MGVKRERPGSSPPPPLPLPARSSSSASGDGARVEAGDLDTPRASFEFDDGASEAWDVTSSAWSSASDAGSAGSRGSGSGPDNATITALDLLPKELRAIANTTRPDSDIPWTSDDQTCYYHKMDDDRCFHPRSCRDCLEMPGCMINQLGQCVNQAIDKYNGYMDFRAAITKNMSGPHARNVNASRTQLYHFPAKTVSYCPVDEPTCRYCKRNDFKQKIDSRFCIGSYNNRKCICISICESPVRNEALVHQNCTNPLSTSTLANEIGHPLMSTPSLFTVIVAPIVLVLVAYQIVKRHRRSRTGSDDTIVGAPRSGDPDGDGDAADSVWSWSTSTTTAQDLNQPEPRVLPTGRLDLAGWQAQRQEMIAKEQLLLAGLESAASPNSGWVDFDDLDGDDRDSWSVDSRRRHSSTPLDTDTRRDGSASPMGASSPQPTTRSTTTTTAVATHVYWTESDLAML